MKVKVIHFDIETNEFVPIALVNVPVHQTDTRALEYAFNVTQNVFGSWSKGPQFEHGEINEDFSENVEVLAPLPTYLDRTLGHRSSMVGDLFVVNGNVYICKGIGFELYEMEIA
jgi:hypothetical protein